MRKTTSPTWRDFSLSFNMHPVTGDLVVLTDARAILQSIRNLIMTSWGEFLMEPDIYGVGNDLVFSLNSTLARNQLQSRITDTITKYETRAELSTVTVTARDDHTLYVYVEFYTLNNSTPVSDTIHLTRLR